MDLVKALNSQYMKEELPEVKVGDTVRVHVRIKEGARERIQVFEGTVIARKHGGIGETVTVRRISYGVGCEKVFPLHSPNVAMIETVRKGKVRRRSRRSGSTPSANTRSSAPASRSPCAIWRSAVRAICSERSSRGT